jgi:hypothetical protein
MGQQHVTLNIGDDGLVKSVGHDMGGSYEIETPKYEQLEINFPKVDGQGESIYETCIMCGKETTTLKSAHIDFRYGYVEGAGQLCRECYMGENRNLITIEGRTILDTPNDAELGAKVRQVYWDSKHN